MHLIKVKNIIPITKATRLRTCKLATGPSQNSLRSNIDSAYPALRQQALSTNIVVKALVELHIQLYVENDFKNINCM